MPPAKNRWTTGTWMIAIAAITVILYTGMLYMRWYIWMAEAGY